MLFLAISYFGQAAVFVLSYLLMWRYLQNYFKQDLANEKNKLLCMYGLVMLSSIVQSLIFLAEIEDLFCQTYEIRFANAII